MFKSKCLLIKDEINDISNPKFCDLKTLKFNSDDKFIYFFIELAVGWKKLFAKAKATGSLGTIYLDIDNDKTLGMMAVSYT